MNQTVEVIESSGCFVLVPHNEKFIVWRQLPEILARFHLLPQIFFEGLVLGTADRVLEIARRIVVYASKKLGFEVDLGWVVDPSAKEFKVHRLDLRGNRPAVCGTMIVTDAVLV